MRNIFSAAGLSLCLVIAACGGNAPEPSGSASAKEISSAEPEPIDEATGQPAPASTPLAPATAADGIERNPEVVIAQWKAAMEARDWAKVRSFWGNQGAASGMTEQQFAEAWGLLKTVHVTVGQGLQEGAAGSSYYEVAAMITGVRKDSLPYRNEGIVTWRRVNDVDGATPEQLRWHIERSTLSPVG